VIRIGVVGATGYTGIELCRLLMFHPKCRITNVYSNQYSGKLLSDIYPQFRGVLDLSLESFDVSKKCDVDVLFLALPHGTSHSFMPALFENKHLKVIDLSADFRLNEASLFESTYKIEHMSKHLLSSIPYAIPELDADKIKAAQCVANPGCYATSIILPMFPLIQNKLITQDVIADSKSGVSGAGRGLKIPALYCEASESFSAYATGDHRHSAEIDSYLGCRVLFSPHLLPMSRGILSSIYVNLEDGVTVTDLENCLDETYNSSYFIRRYDNEALDTKFVAGTNHCLLRVCAIKESSKVVVFSCIDNLIKGAAGQAIQNMNIMYGFKEETGLTQIAPYL
jgi:N-acetyl-gamma-glutamyl-phosphate reductase